MSQPLTTMIPIESLSTTVESVAESRETTSVEWDAGPQTVKVQISPDANIPGVVAEFLAATGEGDELFTLAEVVIPLSRIGDEHFTKAALYRGAAEAASEFGRSTLASKLDAQSANIPSTERVRDAVDNVVNRVRN